MVPPGREWEGKQEVGREERLDERECALREREGPEELTDCHRDDATKPQRPLGELEQESERQSELGGLLRGYVLLDDKADRDEQGSSAGDCNDECYHFICVYPVRFACNEIDTSASAVLVGAPLVRSLLRSRTMKPASRSGSNAHPVVVLALERPAGLCQPPHFSDRPTFLRHAHILQIGPILQTGPVRWTKMFAMQVHLIDGTYELFRHYYGQGARSESGSERAATRGVLASVISLLEHGATHVGVATDHVIESFRNELWDGYKVGDLVPPDLRGQFELLEESLEALGVVVWPMVELEADDALASAASVAAGDPRVEQVLICTPDKDLGQCVIGEFIVQVDRRRNIVLDEKGVLAKFGVLPRSIPDWLALVGDSADGFPGIKGWGPRSAAAVLAHYSHLEAIPSRSMEWDEGVRGSVRGSERLAVQLAADRELADLFKVLATLRVEPGLLEGVDQLCWDGPLEEFVTVARSIGAPQLAVRADKLAQR